MKNSLKNIYLNLSIFCFYFSLITFQVFGVNLAIGDIFLIPIFLIFIYLFLNAKIIRGHDKKSLKNSVIVIVLIIFFSIFSFINYLNYSFSINKSIIELMKLLIALSYGIVAAFFMFLGNDTYRKKFDNFFLYGAVMVSFLGILGVVLYHIGIMTPFQMNGGRARGTLSDTNIMGIFLTVQLPLVINAYFQSKRKKTLCALIIILIGVFLTASKAAILVIILMVVLMLSLFASFGHMKKNIQLLFLLLITLPIIYFLFKDSTIFNLVLSRFSEISSGDASKITTGRTDLWLFAISLMETPSRVLFGIGYGVFGQFIQGQDVPYYLNGITLVHNTLLSMFVETGILCLILILMTLITICIKFIYVLFKIKSIEIIFLFISFINLFIGLNEVNLQNNRFLYIYLVYFYFVINSENRKTRYLNQDIKEF